jgi:CheY-like chemotaxis protein
MGMNKRALILDDSEIVGNLTAFMLERCGIDSDIFIKGAKALEYLTDDTIPYPSLIITDHYLSNKNSIRKTGFMILKAMHKLGADIPVIVLSGATDKRIKQKYLDMGVTAFISKDDDEFIDKLEEVVLKVLKQK